MVLITGRVKLIGIDKNQKKRFFEKVVIQKKRVLCSLKKF